MTGFSHEPVLLKETLAQWISDRDPGAWYIDGTLGGGGHAGALLAETPSRLLGLDRDAEAVAAAADRLRPYADRVVLAHANHRDLPRVTRDISIPPASGILLDLGVSSHQFDTPERGFSYHRDGPLDMRMDASQAMSAHDVVNGYPVADLERVIAANGEERYARRIARAIVAARPVRSTGALAGIVVGAVPAGARYEGAHPARRTFMAVRIEVNSELTGLGEALDAALECLKPGGRLCVITFHSLEDRIVKHRFRLWENPCTCPPKAPMCVCGKRPLAVSPHRQGITPGEDEIARNPRARSARLRITQRIDTEGEA